jgi:2-dehydro-3-deoxyphosphogalactonate aldolase
MSQLESDFHRAFAALPLVAILRGITPAEVGAVGASLYAQGFRLIEVPMNSPNALESIAILKDSLPADALLGAGTVLDVATVQQVQAAGGSLIVMPHADTAVIRAAKHSNMLCIPGVATLTEAFAAIAAGAVALKLFPAELITPAVLKAMRVVLPPQLRVLPVGGIVPDSMAAYVKAGASGFGLGSALYAPGMNAADVAIRARQFVQAWSDLSTSK